MCSNFFYKLCYYTGDTVIIEREERVYSKLIEFGFRKCDDLQTLACLITYMSQDNELNLANKCGHIKALIEQSGWRLKSNCYPIYGILSLLANENEAVRHVLQFYEQLREEKLSLFIGKELYFQTAVSLYISEELNAQYNERTIDPILLAMTDIVIRAQKLPKRQQSRRQ